MFKFNLNIIWQVKVLFSGGRCIETCVLTLRWFAIKNVFVFQVITDLVQGEFMQLGSKETENERFAHYLTKTYRKTASLIANSLKSVSIHFWFWMPMKLMK